MERQNQTQQISQQKVIRYGNERVHLFYIFPLLYVLSVYLLPVFFSIAEEDSIVSYMMYLPIVFGVLNIIVSVKFCKPENRNMMLNASVLVKYALIPFFIVGGFTLLAALFLAFIPVPFMIFLGPTIAAMGAAGGWLIVAFGSPYVIAYLRLSSKTNMKVKAIVIIHCILQFFFTLDVIDVMYLALKEGKWKKLTIFIIVLLVLAAILLFALGILGIVTVLVKGN
ncbi:MAG: hypothetical protein ACLRZ9_01150 [Eubacterium sp.]